MTSRALRQAPDQASASAVERTAARRDDGLRSLEFRAMGSGMRVVVAAGEPGRRGRDAHIKGPRHALRPGVDLTRAPAWFAEWERHLSRFRSDSELSRLNAAAGRPTAVSDILWDVLEAALRAARWTDGLVAPTLLREVERAGYDRSFETMALDDTDVADVARAAADADADAGDAGDPGHRDGGHATGAPATSAHGWADAAASAASAAAASASAAAAAPAALPDWRAIRTERVGHIVTVPDSAQLDLGGIAKGWAADTAARRLAARGPALVDAGGDIAVSGPQPGGQPWPIAVADPRGSDEHLAVLWVGGGGVATSGTDFRRWRRDGRWLHHIIDPRTGEPAVTDVLSATVIARSAAEAEAAAKAALILGSRSGMAWIESQPHLAGLLVGQDGAVYASGRLDQYLGG